MCQRKINILRGNGRGRYALSLERNIFKREIDSLQTMNAAKKMLMPSRTENGIVTTPDACIYFRGKSEFSGGNGRGK